MSAVEKNVVDYSGRQAPERNVRRRPSLLRRSSWGIVQLVIDCTMDPLARQRKNEELKRSLIPVSQQIWKDGTRILAVLESIREETANRGDPISKRRARIARVWIPVVSICVHKGLDYNFELINMEGENPAKLQKRLIKLEDSLSRIRSILENENVRIPP